MVGDKRNSNRQNDAYRNKEEKYSGFNLKNKERKNIYGSVRDDDDNCGEPRLIVAGRQVNL